MSDGDVKARQAEELREIKAGLASRTESLARDLLGEPSSKGGGQLRFGANGALTVSTRGSDRGKFFNHADSSQKGDMLDLIHSRVGGSFASAVEYARSYLGMPKPDYSRPMTDVDRHQMERRQQSAMVSEAEAREKAVAAELARHEAVARRAHKMWGDAGPAVESHPYAERKKMSVAGLRQADGVLLSPMRDADGKLWNLQRISEDGKKRFLAGGRAEGLFDVLGTVDTTKPVAFAEGRATGDAVFESTKVPTVVCYSLGEKARVMRDWRTRNPDQVLLDAVDNDAAKERNAGLEMSKRLKADIGSVPVVPQFVDATAGKDWNDFKIIYGAEAVAQRFALVTQAREARLPALVEMTAERKDLIEKLALRTHKDHSTPLPDAVRAARQVVAGMDEDAVKRTLADVSKPETGADPLVDVIRRMKAGIDANRHPMLERTIDGLAQHSAAFIHDAVFRTRAAYAIQDYEKAKRAPIEMPDALRQEMTALARSYPGLENKAMQAVVAETANVSDPQLVSQIRRAAARMAKSGEAQHTEDAQNTAEQLRQMVRVRGNPPIVVASPGPGEQAPASEAAPPKPAQTSPSASQAPAQPLTQGGVGSQFMRARRDTAPAVLPWQQITTGMENRATAFQRRMDDGKGRRLLATATAGAESALVAMETFYRGQGKPLMNRIEAEGILLPNGVQDVVSEMRRGGKYQPLREEFDRAMADPRFASAYTAMQTTLDTYGKQRQEAVAFVTSRDLPRDALHALDKVDGALAERAAAVPGIQDGRSLLDETTAKLGEALKKAAEQTATLAANFVAKAKQQFQSPSPTP